MAERRGGARAGAGRKRVHSPGVSHRTREVVTRRTPVHINFKYRTNIKNKISLKILKRAVVNSHKFGIRIIHYSMLSNHIHIIAEADNNQVLSAGMRSLLITFAKGLKIGRVQVNRYHLHVLKTVIEAKNAIRYVLFNKQKHEKGRYSKIDNYSSILNLKGALVLIRNFARQKKLLLKVEGPEWAPVISERSYLLKRANHLLLLEK